MSASSKTHDSNLTELIANDDAFTKMQASAHEASQLLKSLAHPQRLMLLCQLIQGEYCVSELETLVGIGQPNLSQQLGVLRKEGLVQTRRESRQIYYRIENPHVLAIMNVLYHSFCSPEN